MGVGVSLLGDGAAGGLAASRQRAVFRNYLIVRKLRKPTASESTRLVYVTYLQIRL